MTEAMRYSLFTVVDHYPSQARTIAEYYREILAQAKAADGMGFDTFLVAEHHFQEYGVFPNPAVALAAIAQHTKRIRLGTAVSVLPFRDPRLVAEDYAMLDQWSNGRVVFGVGSGYLSHEYAGFDVNAEHKREMFDESLDIIRRLLAGESVTHDSAHYKLDGVKINVLPVAGVPPIYVAVLRAEIAYWIGRQGNKIMTVPYASIDKFEEIKGIVDNYQKGLDEDGHKEGEVIVVLHTYVAESDEQARQDCAGAFDLYVETRSYAKRQTYDDVMVSGLSLFGSVETVTGKVIQLYEMGVRHVVIMQNFGGLPHELALKSAERFDREVMPNVYERLARAGRGKE